MPTWGEILHELNGTLKPGKGKDFDSVRRKYLKELHDYTGRAVILYSSSYLEQDSLPPGNIQISLQDMAGFMEAASDIQERQLDLILHSPGGSAEAAESIVTYLRKRFDHIRVFVPIAAMSAATMISLSANEVVMGQHSQLGPIDPQFILQTPEGPRSSPAKAILNQFELAKTECKDASNLPAWMPILRGYGPGLLTQCKASRDLAVNMVSSWLKQYMFVGETDAGNKASEIANWFADYDSFQSHGKRVSPDEAIAKGLKVTWLECDHELQDKVLSVHHATSHTFSGSPACKIIENHNGRAWIRFPKPIVSALLDKKPGEPEQQLPTPVMAPLNRAERRRQKLGR